MSPALATLLLVAGAYLLGSVPFGVLVGRARGVDPRLGGSGNIGATNVFRLLGPGPGAMVMALDIAKGFVPVWLAQTWRPGGVPLQPAAVVLVGVGALLGHACSVFLSFKGGKAVATGCGVLLALDWRVGLATALVFTSTIAVTRYVSVASILGTWAAVAFAGYFSRGTPVLGPFVAITLAAALFITWKHRGNIARLRQGTEPKFGRKDGG